MPLVLEKGRAQITIQVVQFFGYGQTYPMGIKKLLKRWKDSKKKLGF